MKSLYESLLDDEDVLVDKLDDRILIESWLQKNVYRHTICKISNEPNENGKYVVDCPGDVRFAHYEITSLTNGYFEWGKVDGNFYCDECNNLISLEGAPEKVNGSFICSNTKLTSLKGEPKKVGGYFECNSCYSLKSLEGAPKEVGGDFYS